MKDYSKTINLPKTDFSMKANLSEKEISWLEFWYENKVYENLKMKDKLKFVDGINNLELHVYEDCEKGFTRISDKAFNENECLNTQRLTFQHITKAFNNPHTHS